MSRYRKRPVVIEAVRFSGTNAAEIRALTGVGNFALLTEEDRADDLDMSAEVWDKLHHTWVGVYDGQWIIRGVKGEFYPCAADVFEATYEAVDE